MKTKFNKDILDRYLGLLGISDYEPDLKSLNKIITAHLIRIPFENISKIYLKKRYDLSYIPDIGPYLENIEKYNFGGTCYANNYYLYRLLTSLGYTVKLCGADMNNPDVHIVNCVTIEDVEYIVDVGYGAPFLTAMPLLPERDFRFRYGDDTFLLQHDPNSGRSRMNKYRKDMLIHGYTINPIPRDISYFRKIIRESYADSAEFMNRIALTRYSNGRFIAINNGLLTISKKQETNRTLIDDKQTLTEKIIQYFQIPADILEPVLSEIDLERKSVKDI